MVHFLEQIGFKNLSYCVDLVKDICSVWYYKILFSAFIVAFTYFFDPIHTKVLFSLFVLMMADFITGIGATMVRKEKIQSHKISRTAIKVMIYFGTIALCRISEESVHLFWIDDTAIGFLTLTELISNLENVGKMGYETPINLIKKLKLIKKK